MLKKSVNFKKLLYRNSYLLVACAWLVTISFIIDNYWTGNSSIRSVQKNLEAYIRAEEKEFSDFARDTIALRKITSNQYSESELKQWTAKKYFAFIYSLNEYGQTHLLFWNTQTVQPDTYLINAEQLSGFIELQNGFYVWRKIISAKHVFIGLIPVKWKYYITNEYLQNSFAIGKQIENGYDITREPNKYPVISENKKTLFYLTEKTGSINQHNNLAAVWLRIFSVILFFLFLHIISTYIVQHVSIWKGIVFLIATVLLMRIISYITPAPVDFRQFELFDPAIYGSNIILRSLGDLLVNSLLFVWLILFVRRCVLETDLLPNLSKPWQRWAVLVLVSGVLVAVTFTAGHIIRTMVADSQIPFDVVNFFKLNIYSAVGFVVLCCIAMSCFFCTHLLFQLLQKYFNGRMIFIYLVLSVIGLIVLTVRIDTPAVAFELKLLMWLLIYFGLLSNSYLAISEVKFTSSRLVFWLVFFSLSVTIIIITENNKKEIENRKHYAEKLSPDPLGERQMNIMLTDFRNEFLQPNFERFRNNAENRFIKDSLINGNFSGYTNKYETKVYTFDATEQPMHNEDSVGFNMLNTILNTQAKATNITDLYYYDISFDRFNYIAKKIVTDTAGGLMGYVFIVANPKKYKAEALYPELFSKGNFNSIENSSVYYFAVYSSLQLVNNHNDYAFPAKLSPEMVPKDEFFQRRQNGYDELWYRAGPEKVVIIVKKDNYFIEAITLFSYLFCSFLLLTGLFWLLNFIVRKGYIRDKIQALRQLSIRNQVHGTIIFISILSFIVIGIATILFFINRYENNNREKLSTAIHVMEGEVRNSLADLASFDDVIKIYDEANRDKLERIIARISEIHAADINLYDLEGNLRESSFALPYNKGIVSMKMDPQAYYHLSHLKEIQYFKQEKIGRLNYLSNYIPVIDENGNEYAYLNIPYFTSETKLKQEIANFLVAIINLNAFIFLIAGIVAFFITNRITRSFSFISDKMKEVNLGKMNEAIAWNRNDEIGELVKEYNKMVGKLDESAAALAKSEREGAWREMARQVAHEIKNPLTPMKLSLQYLQKAIRSNASNVNELSISVAQTLVEQIDHLSQISGEFSQFANIGNPKNEVFNLNEAIKPVIQLYSMETKISIEWQRVDQPVMINADRTHINRLFTNLIQNAIQAVPETMQAVIKMETFLTDDIVLIKLTDNGTGIPEEMKSKIFTPNFTTKTSGTGLGLAMCKGIVEQAKGNIWFERADGGGTSFFVELPLVVA